MISESKGLREVLILKVHFNSFVNRCLKDDDIGFSALRFLQDSFGAGGHGEFSVKKKSVDDDFNNFQAAGSNEMVDAPT